MKLIEKLKSSSNSWVDFFRLLNSNVSTEKLLGNDDDDDDDDFSFVADDVPNGDNSDDLLFVDDSDDNNGDDDDNEDDNDADGACVDKSDGPVNNPSAAASGVEGGKGENSAKNSSGGFRFYSFKGRRRKNAKTDKNSARIQRSNRRIDKKYSNSTKTKTKQKVSDFGI